jgi:RHS repeat-associated protein
VTSSTDGRGITTSYSYDGLDRVTQISYSDGTPSVSYSYDGAGNTLSTTDASGTTTVDYDPRNLPVARNIPNRGTLGYGYDPVGNLTASTEAAQQTDYVYDAVNNLDYLLEPGALKTDFGYDNDDRRTTTSYPNGVVQTIKYDNAGRTWTIKTGKPGPATLLVDLEYCYALASSTSDCSTAPGDDMNFLQWKRDNLTGKKSAYSYDGADRLEVADDGATRYGYDYDKNGNRTVETVAGASTESYSYSHDVADALCSRRAGTTTGASCDDTANNGSANVLLVVGNATSLTAGETALRNRLTNTLGHKVTVRDDDAAEDVTGQDLVVISEQTLSSTVATKYDDTPVPVLNLEFLSWDDHKYTAGTIYHTTGSTLTVEDATHPVADGPHGTLSGTFSHLTDSTRYTGLILNADTPPAARQIVAHGKSTGYNVAFSYESGDTMASGAVAAGRRLALGYKEETINALTAQGWTLFDNAVAYVAEPSAPARATTTFTHDGAGNMTANGATTAAYNGANQTTRYGAPTFSYAGTGQGDRLSAGGTSFTNGLLGTQRQSTSAGTTDFTSTPDGQLVSMTLPDGAKHYYLFDAQGSVLGLTDSAGARTATYTYDPYGDHHSATGPAAGANPYRYISGYLDPDTGLYKLGIRYYNPDLGRFTQLDPTGRSAHYTYANNSPVMFTDPTGAVSESTLEWVAAGAFAALGIAWGGLGGALAGAALATVAETVIECFFGCDDGVLYTAVKNATINLLAAATFGSVDEALRLANASFGLQSLNAIGDFVAGRVISAVT